MSYGGRHQRSFEEYHAIPDGWDAPSVRAAHEALGGERAIDPVQIPQAWDAWFKYRGVLYNIADLVPAGDAASVELAVRFIELHFIGSCAGYLRALLARRLKHASLAEPQRKRLHQHFAKLVEDGERTHEFRQYLRLWRRIITNAEMTELESKTARRHGDAGAKWLMTMLKPDPCFKRTPEGAAQFKP